MGLSARHYTLLDNQNRLFPLTIQRFFQFALLSHYEATEPIPILFA